MHPVATTEARSLKHAPSHRFASGKIGRNTYRELSRLTGVNVETIRYYEKIKMLRPPPGTEGGRRVYGPNETRLLAFIRRGRELGFGLDDIRALLALGAPGKASCADVREIAAHHLGDIRSKIDDLRKLERLLAKTINQCSGSGTPDCPVVDILDVRRS
jgi:MerR family transcriptional regulator, mercuric resistance operon regulatory protein